MYEAKERFGERQVYLGHIYQAFIIHRIGKVVIQAKEYADFLHRRVL
jgi:hypothetical protein